MDPITWVTVLNLVKKYWWVLPVITAVVYILFLRADLTSKEKTIEQQKQTLTLKEAELSDLKHKITVQNAAVDEMSRRGKEQLETLDAAIAKVNTLRPSTQETIREIYRNRTQDIRGLLFNAARD